MATPEPPNDLPATFMSADKKGKKPKYYEDVHGKRNSDESDEGPGEVCESSGSEAPVKAFVIGKKKKAATSQSTTDSLSLGAIMTMADGSNNESNADREVFLEGLEEYAHAGANRSQEVDPTFQRTIDALAVDRAAMLRRMQDREAARLHREALEQEEVFQDAVQTLNNAEYYPTQQAAPIAPMVAVTVSCFGQLSPNTV